LKAVVDLVGGGDGTRGTGFVYGAWVQNIAPNTAYNMSGLGWVGSYKNGHSAVWLFASNVAQTKGAAANPPQAVFLAGDPGPVLVPLPLLDVSQGNATGPPPPVPGTGGNSSSFGLLPGMSYPTPNLAPVGRRVVVESLDAPKTTFLAYHQISLTMMDETCPLIEAQYNLTFTSYLVFWSSPTGIPDGSGTPPPNGGPTERTYAVILQQPWTIVSDFTVDANGNGTGPGPITIDPTAARAFQPVAPFAVTSGVLTPPRALDVLAQDARK
jgi:hypothetical protein